MRTRKLIQACRRDAKAMGHGPAWEIMPIHVPFGAQMQDHVPPMFGQAAGGPWTVLGRGRIARFTRGRAAGDRRHECNLHGPFPQSGSTQLNLGPTRTKIVWKYPSPVQESEPSFPVMLLRIPSNRGPCSLLPTAKIFPEPGRHDAGGRSTAKGPARVVWVARKKRRIRARARTLPPAAPHVIQGTRVLVRHLRAASFGVSRFR